jgi:hypothetical protein
MGAFMELDSIGFFIGLIGAFWMKTSLGMLGKERERQSVRASFPIEESPALKAFVRGLALILLGLGLETAARLF